MIYVLMDSAPWPSHRERYGELRCPIFPGWKSTFNNKNLGSREELAKQGVTTYVQESSNKPGPTLEDVYQDILNIGRIFRVEDRAKKLVSSIREQVESIQTQIGTVEKAENIFDDIDKSFAEVSWEEVVKRNPDVIVILDYGDTSLANKEK